MVIAPNRTQRKDEKTVYEDWALEEGIPIQDGSHVEDLRAITLAPWARKGGAGALLHHEATPSSNNCYVCEIPPGGQLEPQRHMYEEMVYVLSGRGSTTVWQDDRPKQSFEWQPGSLFAIPLNAHYQHFNASGRDAARYLAVTNAPVVMNLFASADFVFNNPYVFREILRPEHGPLLSVQAEQAAHRPEGVDLAVAHGRGAARAARMADRVAAGILVLPE